MHCKINHFTIITYTSAKVMSMRSSLPLWQKLEQSLTAINGVTKDHICLLQTYLMPSSLWEGGGGGGGGRCIRMDGSENHILMLSPQNSVHKP